MEIWKNLDDAMEAFKKNDPEKLVKSLAKAIRLHSRIVEVPDFYKQILEERIESYPNDLDSLVCYIQMETQRGIWRENISKASAQFPEDEYLALSTALFLLIYKKDAKAAMNYVERVLKIFPEYEHLLYCKILAVKSFDVNNDVYFKSIDALLAAVPDDSPYVPECHYLKAAYYCSIENKLKFIECYEAGLAAEKKQLSCFLPFRFKGCGLLENRYLKEISMDKKAYQQERKKIDPKRKFLISENRQLFKSHVDENGVKPFTPSQPLQGRYTYKNDWSTLKKITLKDMNPMKLEAYKECILEAKIIDWAVFEYCIHTVIEDENGDIQRLTFKNWALSDDIKKDIKQAMKIFRPNVKISIACPYYTGNEEIIVFGSDFVSFDTSMIDKFCHVCGKEAKSLLSCSNCKMALYCSKECEKIDQTDFKHKEICENLKIFKTA
uniref:MYND-type domain-containing protein n=1 Tax=Panagrolaimus davidi TaxID=227884 RepID=A0A914PKU6_9BILA